jgi:hypothetical protein
LIEAYRFWGLDEVSPLTTAIFIFQTSSNENTSRQPSTGFQRTGLRQPSRNHPIPRLQPLIESSQFPRQPRHRVQRVAVGIGAHALAQRAAAIAQAHGHGVERHQVGHGQARPDDDLARGRVVGGVLRQVEAVAGPDGVHDFEAGVGAFHGGGHAVPVDGRVPRVEGGLESLPDFESDLQPPSAGNSFTSPAAITSTDSAARINPISRVMTLMPVWPMSRAMGLASEKHTAVARAITTP